MVAKINTWMENAAKRNAEKENLLVLKTEKHLFVTKQNHIENQDLIGEKCTQGGDGNFSLDG